MDQVKIGDYLAAAESERFRIFPKNRHGESIPVTRINHFLYLQCTRTGALVVFKRYLHQKVWFWRDSRDKSHCAEDQVISEVARMLFSGDRSQAEGLLLKVLTGAALAA